MSVDAKHRKDNKSNSASSKVQEARESNQTIPARFHIKRILISAATLAGFTVLLIVFLHYDRSNKISHLIQSTGPFGIAIGTALMALISLLPVPAEFLMIMFMKIFGPWWGMLYSWAGSMIAAILTFYLARHYGRRLLKTFVSEERLSQVSRWIGDRGVIGLLLSRIVPLPFIVVNYTAGISKSVKPWNYIWTSAIGGIPYYVGAALVFLGVSKRYMLWLIIGGCAVLIIWILGYLLNRHVEFLKRWTH